MTAEQSAFPKELRGHFDALMTLDVRGRVEREGPAGPQARSIRRQIGADGWLGVEWPEEYGGRGLAPVELTIFLDEAERLSAPSPTLALETIGPTLMKFGRSGRSPRSCPASGRQLRQPPGERDDGPLDRVMQATAWYWEQIH